MADDVKLEKSRTVMFYGDVTEEKCEAAIKALFEYDQTSQDPIALVVCTYGGSIYDMFAMHDAIKMCKAPVFTFGIGKIMSAGNLILACGVRRKMAKNATLMIHQGYLDGNYSLHQMKLELRQQEDLALREAELLALYTKRNVDWWMDMFKNRPNSENYFTAEQAVEIGVVDEIISR